MSVFQNVRNFHNNFTSHVAQLSCNVRKYSLRGRDSNLRLSAKKLLQVSKAHTTACRECCYYKTSVVQVYEGITNSRIRQRQLEGNVHK
jgi:hypothetical protein